MLSELAGMVEIISRDQVNAAQAQLAQLPQVELPVTHHFSFGVYGREMTIPAGVAVAGKIHKYANLLILMSGDISLLTDDGVVRVQAPFSIVSQPGAKRIAFAHVDSVLMAVHGTHETDLDKIESFFIAQNDADYIEFVEQLKISGGAQ